MSDSQPPRTLFQKRNKTLTRLESHADASAGPSTDGTDGSTPHLLPLPRPDPIESSPELSPGTVAGNADNLEGQTAPQTIIVPSRNAFARPNDRSGFETHAGSSNRSILPVFHSSGSGVSDEPPTYVSLDLSADEPIPQVGLSTSQPSDVITPPLYFPGNAAVPPCASVPTEGGFNFDFPARSSNANNTAAVQPAAHSSSTDSPYRPSTPDLHAQPSNSSLRATLYPRPTPTIATNDTTPRRQVQLGEHIPDELPRREEPPALTTFARIQRGLARTFQTRKPSTNAAAAIEMNDFAPSPDVPRLAHDGEATEQRRRVDDHRRLESEITDGARGREAAEEMRRQRAYGILMPMCVVSGVVIFAIIYLSVTKGE